MPTPIVVRKVQGVILTGSKPLQGADVWLRFSNGWIINARSERDGSFEFKGEHDPVIAIILHPVLHQMFRNPGARPGTYQLKVTKPGFHSTIATVIVSASAPEPRSICIDLHPGPRAKAEVLTKEMHPREALAGFDRPFPERPKFRHADIDIPVSLRPGTLQTTEFSVQSQDYYIMIQAEHNLPFHVMECMMAVSTGPLVTNDCHTGPLLQAEWTVWDGNDLVAYGLSSLEGAGKFTKEHITKILGGFVGQAGKKYVVQVKFTKDATPLNPTNPRLIVVPFQFH